MTTIQLADILQNLAAAKVTLKVNGFALDARNCQQAEDYIRHLFQKNNRMERKLKQRKKA
jgi:hypothetical protein